MAVQLYYVVLNRTGMSKIADHHSFVGCTYKVTVSFKGWV